MDFREQTFFPKVLGDRAQTAELDSRKQKRVSLRIERDIFIFTQMGEPGEAKTFQTRSKPQNALVFFKVRGSVREEKRGGPSGSTKDTSRKEEENKNNTAR